MRKRNIILSIICLVVADQGIKLVIANYFIHTKFDIIESILGFHPIYNDKYSYFNAILKLDLGLLPHVIVLVFLQLIVIILYDYSKITQRSTRLAETVFIFGQAASICVFCGFFFWKDGILDFIFLYPFTFDLKDIYLNCFALLTIFNFYINRVDIKTSNLNMTNYIKKRWIEINLGKKK